MVLYHAIKSMFKKKRFGETSVDPFFALSRSRAPPFVGSIKEKEEEEQSRRGLLNLWGSAASVILAQILRENERSRHWLGLARDRKMIFNGPSSPNELWRCISPLIPLFWRLGFLGFRV